MKCSISKLLIVTVLAILLTSLSNCATTPMENLYEPGVTTPMITLSLSPEHVPPLEVTRSERKMKVKYRVNRSIAEFKNRLKPKGKIECTVSVANILVIKGLDYGEYYLDIMPFDIDSLSETGGFLDFPFGHFKYNFRDQVRGRVNYTLTARYKDAHGKRHKGSISNRLAIPAVFHDKY